MTKPRRPSNNRDQNRQVREAAKLVGLTEDQSYRFAEDVEKESRHYGADLDFHALLKIAQEFKDET